MRLLITRTDGSGARDLDQVSLVRVESGRDPYAHRGDLIIRMNGSFIRIIEPNWTRALLCQHDDDPIRIVAPEVR